MIRGVSHCPYCGHLSAGVDDDYPDFVLAPDRAGGRVCRHLAFVSASLAVYDLEADRPMPGLSGHWRWTRGEGTLVLPDGPIDPVSEYVEEVVCGSLAGASLPAGEYRVGGGTAGARDRARPGSGEFPLPYADWGTITAVFDGHGLYGPDPDALVAEVRRLAGVA
jgi:hypothetical protein